MTVAELPRKPGGNSAKGKEQRANIFATWRRDALGRLVQRRSAEAALLAAQSFAAPGKSLHPGFSPAALLTGTGGSSSSRSKAKEDAPLPLYAVRWHQSSPADRKPEDGAGEKPPAVLKLTSAPLAEGDLQRALEAARAGAQIVAAALPTPGAFCSQEDEVSLGWRFVQLIQRLLEDGVGARLLVVCPAAATGALVAGASKAVAMEDSSLKIQRAFVPLQCLQRLDELVPRLCALSSAHKDETDLWIRDAGFRGLPFVPRLERMPAGSAKASRLPAHGLDGEPAKLLLTGATGGLGKAVVSWLIKEQGFQPEQLLLLRRMGSSKLEGDLARCTVVEAAKVDSTSVLQESLLQVRGVTGILHLAGVLDDGIVGGMTEDRMRKVAQPKCGMLVALLNAAKELQWPLQWTVGFSSTSSLFGYAGQVNYCAANALLDQLAVFSSEGARPEGDRAPCRFITVNWGPWGEAGMAQ
ncbi:swnK, partial [Symbiodinium natans]